MNSNGARNSGTVDSNAIFQNGKENINQSPQKRYREKNDDDDDVDRAGKPFRRTRRGRIHKSPSSLSAALTDATDDIFEDDDGIAADNRSQDVVDSKKYDSTQHSQKYDVDSIDNCDDDDDGDGEGYSFVSEAIAATTNNLPIGSYKLESRTHSKARDNYSKKNASDSILKSYFWNDTMIALPIILRDIFINHPDLNDVYVILAVLMYEYVEFEMKAATLEEHEQMIEWFREKWALVGRHMNLGQRPNGNILMHSLFAFATAECLTNRFATDAVDGMKRDNHTMKYAGECIMYDHLVPLFGEDALTKEDADEIANTLTTRSDLFTEIGVVGKGNDKDDYHMQLKARHKSFCEQFKERMNIMGKSFFDGKEVKKYHGCHFSALIGGLECVMRAELTLKTTGKALTVNVQTTRGALALFNFVGQDDYEVRSNGNVNVCRSTHPNFYERWLTTYDLDIVKKMAYSHSVAWLALHGATVTLSNRRVRLHLPPEYALSDGIVQRWTLRNGNAKEWNLNQAIIEEINEVTKKTKVVKREAEEIKAEVKKTVKQTKQNQILAKRLAMRKISLARKGR